MTAYKSDFPWPSYDGRFKFFEDRVNGHEKVEQLVNLGGGFFEVTRRGGDKLRAFVCECYTFGVAEFIEVRDHCADVSAIVISSSWCGYTDDVKDYCKALKIGVFNISEFMGALNREEFWSYVVPERKRL
ncbi:hypothetical protein [Rhizobium leguminosarum]|uniref:hypothetical protein n=1 Tax=Rhizobium leguminosarum TaxID=384 RepID=UPI001C953D34|nr:hypothetical protein [Rhizobium leguminosarum]MBY5827671.1 hypothetical protein [Rhizobium leguminosarum]